MTSPSKPDLYRAAYARGDTIVAIAKRHGVTKQAVHEAIKRGDREFLEAQRSAQNSGYRAKVGRPVRVYRCRTCGKAGHRCARPVGELTRAQVQALTILADGEAHETSSKSRHDLVGGITAKALAARGLAVLVDGAYVITSAGKAALDATTKPRRAA